MENKVVNLQGWRISEEVVVDGEVFIRIDDCEEGINYWTDEGFAGQLAECIKDYELTERLEDVYQESGQGYSSFGINFFKGCLLKCLKEQLAEDNPNYNLGLRSAISLIESYK